MKYEVLIGGHWIEANAVTGGRAGDVLDFTVESLGNIYFRGNAISKYWRSIPDPAPALCARPGCGKDGCDTFGGLYCGVRCSELHALEREIVAKDGEIAEKDEAVEKLAHKLASIRRIMDGMA